MFRKHLYDSIDRASRTSCVHARAVQLARSNLKGTLKLYEYLMPPTPVFVLFCSS